MTSVHGCNEQQLEKLYEDWFLTQFRLDIDPLVKIKLVKTDVNTYMLFFNAHHIIIDGWSVDILIDELVGSYNAYSANEASPLKPLTIQYKGLCKLV